MAYILVLMITVHIYKERGYFRKTTVTGLTKNYVFNKPLFRYEFKTPNKPGFIL